LATQTNIDKLNQSISSFLSLPKERIFRPELGVESSEKFLSDVLNDLYDKIAVIQQVAKDVSNTPVQTVTAHLDALFNHLSSFSALNNQDFVAQKPSVVENVYANIDAILNVWPQFYITHLELFPKESKEQKSHSEAIALTEDIKAKAKSADETLESLKQIIEETNQIKEAAKNTAQGVSVIDAQKQFTSAQSNLYLKIIIASAGAAIFLIWFFGLAFYFLNAADNLNDEWTWKIAYHASIRGVILASIAAISTYFLTVLKAYLHLLEHNLHRQRVANSTEAFVAAATTPEQKDLILAKLVESVTNFGDSGLLKASSNDSPASNINFDVSAKT